MASFQISLSPTKRAAGRFISLVRREIQKAFAEEQAARGLTQSAIAAELNVNRSVIHRQIVGYENMSIGRVGQIASILGRRPVFRLEKPEEARNYFAAKPPQDAGRPSDQLLARPVNPPPFRRLPLAAR